MTARERLLRARSMIEKVRTQIAADPVARDHKLLEALHNVCWGLHAVLTDNRREVVQALKVSP